MCGVSCTGNDNRSNSELEDPLLQDSSVMPPSITLGTDPPKPAPPPNDDSCHILNQQGATANREIPTIDLSSDDAELQKAIALSLQDHPLENTELVGISAEERDVSKVIEDSIFDATPRTGTTIELLNPHDRQRLPETPVGLKNIGNSCWFNVVIQPLFFIPFFREMIIKYPKSVDDDLCTSSTKSQRLLPTLRQLFSLLIASDKKYIDPTEAVTLFLGNEMRKNTQQDVCEFIHKLLEKLEEEFKLLLKKQGIEKESLETNLKESDFMKLFYGVSKKEVDEEDGGPKLETFGQYPLTVKKYKDIHESILASMANGTAVDLGEPVQQDTWFKTLPSILIFSLSRYEFSKEKQRAEKVHNKFEFPEYLFMDRYMEYNKEIVKEKHQKVAKIKQELNTLYNSLEKYQKYGSGEAKYPITDILKYVLEFAESKGIKNEDVNMHSPSMEIDAVECTVNDIEMSESGESGVKVKGDEAKADLPPEQMNVVGELSPNKRMRILPPAPQNVNPDELAILQTCIPRWLNEVESQVHNLKKSIHELEQQLLEIYEEPALQQIPYKLHAVVVHEGQASGGHYWVYIFDSSKNIWWKFNDIQVSTSNWEELIQESVGGQNNASAYCLMYIDQTKYEFLFSNPDNEGLPIDLQEYVKRDNAAFLRELQDWENRQEEKEAPPPEANNFDIAPVPATAPNSPDVLCIEDEDVNFMIEIKTMFSQLLSKALQDEKECTKQKNKSQWIHSIVTNELLRIRELASSKTKTETMAEPSLLDLGIYLINNRENELLSLYAYEILWHVSLRKYRKTITMIQHDAAGFLHQIQEKCGDNMRARYQGWKKHYLTFLDCTWNFVYGFRKLQVRQTEAALLYLMKSLKIHKQLSESPPDGCAKTLDIRALSFCHRKCLQIVSDKLADAFIAAEGENKTLEITDRVTKLVIPSMWIVLSSKLPEDNDVGELVRKHWFQVSEEVPPEKADILRQILQVFVANETYEIVQYAVTCPQMTTVLSLYKEYRDAVLFLRKSVEKSDAQISDL